MATAQRRWAAELLHFWFGRLRDGQWFASDAQVDAELERRFLAEWSALQRQPSWAFARDPDTALAAVILFDQIPRNVFRSQPRAFSTDRKARDLARLAIARGFDRPLPPVRRQFLYMPLMHSEDIADQRLSLRVFAPLGRAWGFPFARAHHKAIARFGRFPHRNALLGRASSKAEERMIAAGYAW